RAPGSAPERPPPSRRARRPAAPSRASVAPARPAGAAPWTCRSPRAPPGPRSRPPRPPGRTAPARGRGRNRPRRAPARRQWSLAFLPCEAREGDRRGRCAGPGPCARLPLVRLTAPRLARLAPCGGRSPPLCGPPPPLHGGGKRKAHLLRRRLHELQRVGALVVHVLGIDALVGGHFEELGPAGVGH